MTPTLDAAALGRLRELMAECCPGPWRYNASSGAVVSNMAHPLLRETEAAHRMTYSGKPGREGELVAALFNAAPALLALAEREQWRPIESAPKDGTRVLLASKGGAAWVGCWRDSSAKPYSAGWTRFNCDDVGWQPDGWRPLPDAPGVGS